MSVVGKNEIVLQWEQGENLVFQRVFLNPEQKKIEKHEQRKKVFKTKCKVQGKCCNLNIYSGSIENLVSTVVMEKMKLKILDHPNPY